MEASRRHNALAQFLSRIRTGATPAIATIAGLLVTGAAYMLALVGTSSAATVGVEAGNNWFCNSTFENGVCDTTVTVGDTVGWDVVEGVHTVTECDDGFENCGQGGRFDSGNMDSTDPPYEQTFSSPGIYEYLCTLHEQQMKGRVVVSAATPSTTATLSSTPTPSPTLTPSPTPSPTPFSPYVLQTIKDIGEPLLTDIAPFPSAPHLAVVTTQAGDLWKVDLSDPLAPATAFGNVRDRLTRTGDEGLLSVAFDAADPQRLYINYTTGTHYYRPYNNGPVSPTPTMPANPKRNRVARYDIAAGVMSVASEAIIYESLRPGNWHTLGDLAFDGDGNLYAGSGDGGDVDGNFDPDDSQSAINDLATIIRIDPIDNAPGYAIPAGNPFDDGAGPNADQVWAFGLRSPWRLSFDRATGDLWAGDVSQWGAEEVNHVVPGGNYGWSVMEGEACHIGGCTEPADHIPPRTSYCNYFCPTADDCAIVGGYVYRGQAMPELQGWYIYGDFCSGRIRAVDTESSDPAVILLDTDLSPVSFAETSDGELLVLNFNNTIHMLTHNGDTDGDGDLDVNDNCPGVYNPIQQDADGDSFGDQCDPGDTDGDGYADENESRYLDTQVDAPCGAHWPSNLLDIAPSDNKLDVQDLISFLAPIRRLDSSALDWNYNTRWDLLPGPTSPFPEHINILDLSTMLNGSAGSPAYPPMFSGSRAFGKTCPFPP